MTIVKCDFAKALVFLAALLILTGIPYAFAGAGQTDSDARARAYFTDLPVIDQNGTTRRFYSDVLQDRVVLINFIFSECEGACPLLTGLMNRVRDQLGELSGRAIRFVSISIDPVNDTPQALKKFAGMHNADRADWLFLTGDPGHLEYIVKKFGQYNGDRDAHSTLLLAANVATRHWSKITPTTPVEGIAEKLRLLAAE